MTEREESSVAPSDALVGASPNSTIENGKSTVESATDAVAELVEAGQIRRLDEERPARLFSRAFVRVDSLGLGETFGRRLEDACVGRLAAILQRYPQWSRITVTRDLRVLAGHLWVAAAQRLGLAEVEVTIIEAET
jgi:hypothetical protein